jgi:hypothetical protein
MVTVIRASLAVLAILIASQTVQAANWADAMFDELSKDFGTVPRGPTLQHHFRIKNNTGQVVVISAVRVSCGCVSATALTNVLQPGESTAVLARMDTTRFVGVKNVTIFVTFARPNLEEVRLWVQANGRDDFLVSPDSLAFGVVKRGAGPERSVNLTFYGNNYSQVTEVKTDSNYLQASVKEVSRQASQVDYQLNAKVRADTPAGRWYSDVWLTTNNPGIPKIRVPLTIEVESALTVSPDAVVIGPLKANEEGERKVIVRGTKPFKIVKTNAEEVGLAIKTNSEDAKTIHVLTVKAKGGDKIGDSVKKLKISTDLDEAEKEVELQVTTQVAP